MNNAFIALFIFSAIFLLFVASAYFKFFYINVKRKINPEKLKRIQNTQLLYRTSSGGRLDFMNYTIGCLFVYFHKEGIIINPLLQPKIYLLYSEIYKFEKHKGLMTQGIAIYHNSNLSMSPLILYTKDYEKIKSILEQKMA